MRGSDRTDQSAEDGKTMPCMRVCDHETVAASALRARDFGPIGHLVKMGLLNRLRTAVPVGLTHPTKTGCHLDAIG